MADDREEDRDEKEKPAPVIVTGRVVDDRTGAPIAGAMVALEGAGRYRGEGPMPRRFFRSSGQGSR